MTPQERSKKGRASKRKGAEFELSVAKILTKWWGETFKRTPLSGGWAKGVVCGDVLSLDENSTFPFSVECKRDESFSLYQLLKYPATGPLKKWWYQAWSESKEGKIPLLIIKENLQEPYAVLDRKTFDHLNQADYVDWYIDTCLFCSFDYNDDHTILCPDKLVLFPLSKLIALTKDTVLFNLELEGL